MAVLLVAAMVVIVIAQLSTNMAANVVSPSNDFSNLAPRLISFKMGGLITAVIGIVSFPWKLYQDVGAYIFTWLVGYGSLLAAFGAVMIVDYWLLRRTRLDVSTSTAARAATGSPAVTTCARSSRSPSASSR